MNILVTNDDGVHSPGLWSLAESLQSEGNVTVVAPDRDRSGVGASMTLLDVVRAQEFRPPIENLKAFAVEGTPADCVILAVESLVKSPVDLVVSGINQGSNLGLDVLTSGTVGAAFQGFFRKIPAIAVSVASLTNVQYDTAAETTKLIASFLGKTKFELPLLVNVNLPNVSQSGIVDVALTKLGPRLYSENVSQEHNGRRIHYWIRHNKPTGYAVEEGTDVKAVRDNKISITPITSIGGHGQADAAFKSMTDSVRDGLGLTAKV